MFKQGDFVVCIRKSQFHDCEGEVGKIYTVRIHTRNGLFLNEQSDKWKDNGLDHERFRLATEEDFVKKQYTPYLPLLKEGKAKEPSAEKQQMKKQLDKLREKLHTLEKIYNKMD